MGIDEEYMENNGDMDVILMTQCLVLIVSFVHIVM